MSEKKETKVNGGIIFKNNYKDKDSHPDYKGTINVDGVDKEIALWVKDGKNGKFFSVAISEPYVKNESQAKVEQPAEDDLPF